MRFALLFALLCSSLAGWGADKQSEVIVFTGGENAVVMQQNGYLELLLTLAQPTKHLQFRNMAWEGDTVFEQPRELNFPSWKHQLERFKATTVIAMFGQTELLQKTTLEEFLPAYARLLDLFAMSNRQVIAFSPIPFESADPLLPPLAERNPEVVRWSEEMAKVAQSKGCKYVDLTTAVRSAPKGKRFTRDGLHLNDTGHWQVATEVCRQLGLHPKAGRISLNRDGTVSPKKIENIRQLILTKNRYWFDYWRPMNWAFLHGDRVEQPSSRDHRNLKLRWFPDELEQFIPLIEEKESRIRALAQGIKN